MANGDDQRISLSVGALRTEIRLANAELKIDLLEFIAKELEKKASADGLKEVSFLVGTLNEQMLRKDAPLVVAMETFEKAQNDFAQGNFTPAQRRAFFELVTTWWEQRGQHVWTLRRRVLAMVAAVVAVATLGVGVAGIIVTVTGHS